LQKHVDDVIPFEPDTEKAMLTNMRDLGTPLGIGVTVVPDDCGFGDTRELSDEQVLGPTPSASLEDLSAIAESLPESSVEDLSPID